MRRRAVGLGLPALGVAVAAGLAGRAARSAGASAYEAIAWSTLVPAEWDGRRVLASLNIERLSDGDPEAREAMKTLRKAWDAAPANVALNNRRVRLSGYLVPLEFGPDVIREFLLVPYFGACIHEPAPPANQVVHVVPARPVTAAERGTSAVTASGTIWVTRGETGLAVTGYRMQADSVVPYRP